MLLRILLNAETPLAFRAGRNTARTQTLPYAPGVNLLGGLADAHRLLDRPSAEFARLFLQDQLHVGNCYGADFGSKALSGTDRPVLPVPLTARTCKRFGGFAFHAEIDEDDRAGVTDALIPLALFKMSEEQRGDLLDRIRIHPRTGHPLDRLGGFFRRGAQPQQVGQPAARLGLRTRTGFNYHTGTVQSSILYSRQVISEGATFWGRWWVADHLAEAFHCFVAKAIEQRLVSIGNNRTRGFGLVRFNAQALDEDNVDALANRVAEFTRLFKAAASDAGIATPAGAYVPITLTSDAILQDSLLRARLRLDAGDLDIPGAQLIFHAAGTRHVEGWSALWGMPKADDWAITMGSVFLFALPQPDAAVYAALLRLEQQGIGLRRAEGFGMVSVANLFHIDLAGRFR